jgi:predicted dehydrogenase
LAKVDPALIAQFAAMAKIDPSLITQFTNSVEPKAGLSFSKPTVTPGEPLRLEIESFLESVRTRCEPRVTARQGRNALALALEIQASMATHAHRAGLEDFFNPGA